MPASGKAPAPKGKELMGAMEVDLLKISPAEAERKESQQEQAELLFDALPPGVLRAPTFRVPKRPEPATVFADDVWASTLPKSLQGKTIAITGLELIPMKPAISRDVAKRPSPYDAPHPANSSPCSPASQ